MNEELTPKEVIDKYSLSLESPPMDKDELAEASYVLIRHGFSQFNYKELVSKTEFGPRSAPHIAVELDPFGMDPELHPSGIVQCEFHQEEVNKIDYKVVFTSPMQRTMMTTIHMFKNHPNKENIKFVVLPFMREVYHTTNDIAIDCFEMMDKFGEGKEAACGLNFDFSNMFMYGVPELWQTYTIADVEKQKMLLNEMKQVNPEPVWEAPQKTNYQDAAKKIFPNYAVSMFENNGCLVARANNVRRYLRENLRANPLKA